MPEWKKGWKVIKKDGRRSSYVSLTLGGRIYKKDVVVGRARGCGPLAVFTTRKAAREFKNTTLWDPVVEDFKVVRCIYLESKHTNMWKCDYQYKAGEFYTLDPGRFPKGTVLAEKVKCLE